MSELFLKVSDKGQTIIRIESDKKSLQLWHIALYLHKHHRYTNENQTTTMEIGTMNGRMELLCELVVSYSHYKRQAPPPHTHTDHMDNAMHY